MGEEYPTGLVLLNINRYIIINVDDIITRFNKKKKIAFCHINFLKTTMYNIS